MSLIPNAYGRRSNVFDPASHDIFDPFPHDLPLMSSSHHGSAQLVASQIDWRETPQAHVFVADVPGLKKEEVKVEVEEGNILQISSHRSQDQEANTDTWHRVERSSGSFVRRFRLPENAELDQIKAGMDHGVLTVTVPKVEAKKPALKAIQITG